MEFCGIIAYYFQTSFLQSATGLETFLSFFKGRAFPSSSTYLSISSSISFLFSTWEENSSNMSVSRMARSVMAARYDLSSSEPAPSRLSSTSPTLSRSAGVTAGTMALLTGEQHSLLAYQIFRDEIMVGGFCQLIQNGYGGYIFDNPFAKVMRLWGAEEFSKLVYRAKKIYDAHREDLEKERTEDEFMAMYEQYEAFDELEEEYFEMEEQVTVIIASYVDEHLELFGEIIK